MARHQAVSLSLPLPLLLLLAADGGLDVPVLVQLEVVGGRPDEVLTVVLVERRQLTQHPGHAQSDIRNLQWSGLVRVTQPHKYHFVFPPS